MSHSQFHSTNLFILRHAWLNLWDKHMTTGRINQVTTIRMHRMQHQVLAQNAFLNGCSLQGMKKPQEIFHHSPRLLSDSTECTHLPGASERITLYLRSHIFQTSSFCCMCWTEITAFKEDYQAISTTQKERVHDRGVSPSGFIAKSGLAIGNKSTFFSSTNTCHKWTVSDLPKRSFYQRNTHYTPMLQSSTPCLTGTSMDQFAKHQPTHLENDLKGRC